jgi:hypothetical protein
MTTLYELAAEYQKLLDIALESDEIDDETFEYIQKLDGAIEKKIENIACVIKELENNTGIVNNEIDRLSERASRYYKNLKALKSYVVNTMEQVGKKKIETPTMTLGVRKSESTEIDNEFIEEAKEKNLYKLMRIVPERVEADKTAIKEYIKQGNKLEHAKIVEKKNLSIR